MQLGEGVVSRLDSVPYNNIVHICETAAEHGVDLRPQLQACGLGAQEDCSDLSREQYYGFLQQVLPTLDIPAFGVHVGKKFSLGDYGVLGYACISSANLRQFLQTFFRFQQIVGSSASFSEGLRVRDDEAMIVIHSTSLNEHLHRFDVEEAMGQWVVGAGDMLRQSDAMFSAVHFTCAEPDYGYKLRELLGCPVLFDQPENQMVFPAALLDEPIVMANEVMAQLCEQQCESLLASLTREHGLVEQVRRLIINRPGRVPTPDSIAQDLNMSYRTLRRKLSQQGTSFKAILGEVRMGLAGEYMKNTNLSTQEIAYLLGYSEASNFHRAFKLWFDQTPGEYRRNG